MRTMVFSSSREMTSCAFAKAMMPLIASTAAFRCFSSPIPSSIGCVAAPMMDERLRPLNGAGPVNSVRHATQHMPRSKEHRARNGNTTNQWGIE